MICSRIKSIAALALICLSLVAIPSVECAKKSSSSASSAAEPTIEEVTAKQLERILADKDYVAVYWCKLKCLHDTPTQHQMDYCEDDEEHQRLVKKEKKIVEIRLERRAES
jgi:hypothetical protein